MDQPYPTAGDARPPTEPPPPPPLLHPDPGSRGAAGLAWVVLLVVLPLVVVMQQLRVSAEPETDKSRITAPQGDNTEVSARMGTRVAYAVEQAAANFQQQIDQTAETPLQRFRAAVASGELTGAREAASRLADLIADLEREPDDPLASDEQARRAQLLADAGTLLPYYEDIAEEGPAAASLDDETLNGLVERHGYFGELVRIASLPEDHELRASLLGGALLPFGIMILVMALMGLGVLTGLGLGITAIVLMAGGRLRMAMPRPAPGGSVYLETAVLFVVCFALLQVTQAVAAIFGEGAQAVVGMIALPAQWLLLLVPLWPLARGVSWARLRDDLGLRAPKGVLVEIFAGIVGYLALLPLVIAGVAVMFVLLIIQEMVFPADPDSLGATNPILDMVKSLDPAILILLFTLATIWAPLCEELVFRGALFRHMRSRLALPLAAILSALMFGMMHGYALIQLIPVTILGFNFALIRAWRGSLYGAIAAHALNNAVVLSLLFALAHVLYG